MPILFGLTLIIIVFIYFSKSRDKNAKKNSDEFWQKERDSLFVAKKDISSLDYILIPYASLPFRYYVPGKGSPTRVASTPSSAAPATGFSDATGEFTVLAEKTEKHYAVDALLSEIASEDMPATDNSYVRAPKHTAPLADELSATELELCKLADSKILNLTGISNTELRMTYGTANLDLLTAYDQNFTVLIRTLQKWGTLLASAEHKEDAVTVLSYAVSIGSDIAGTYALLARLYKERGELTKIEELKTSAEALTTLMKPSILRDLEQISAKPM